MNLPSIITAKRQFHRKRKAVLLGPPPAVLVLKAASFDVDASTVTMQFDRAIDVSAMDVSSVSLGSIITGSTYVGDGSPVLVDAKTVRVPLSPVGSYGGSDTELSVSGASGIVASDDGGTWAGVSGLGLPFAS